MITTGAHREIAVRYAWMSREQKYRRGSKKLLALLRMREMERVFAHRFGDYLPDDDAGMEDLTLAANQIAQMEGNAEDHILRWAFEWAPWFFRQKDVDPVLFARRIAKSPRRYKADTLARLLNLTMSDRTAIGITTIGAIDCNKQQRAALRRERNRVGAEARRRARGAKPRAQYEAESLSRTKPWERMGMSRSTWYAKGKPMPGLGTAGQVRVQQTEYPLMLPTHLSDTDARSRSLKDRRSKKWGAGWCRLPIPSQIHPEIIAHSPRNSSASAIYWPWGCHRGKSRSGLASALAPSKLTVPRYSGNAAFGTLSNWCAS